MELLYQIEGRQAEILEELQSSLQLGQTRTRNLRRVYYETFDWRLHRAGMTLQLMESPKGRSLVLVGADGSRRRLSRVDFEPGFAWDMPAGPFRDAVASAIGIRVLIPLVELRLCERGASVEGPAGKRVAGVELVEGFARSGRAKRVRLTDYLRLRGVRGYEGDFDRVRGLLEKQLGLEPSSRSELEKVLETVGRQPDDYSSKLRIPLDPGMRADAAVKEVLRTLLKTIERNAEGTRQDLDSEFLHDFRVAVRRTRSALGQLKGLFPQRTVDRFRREFAWLGSITGPTRDLDVYLLKFEGFRRQLPESVRDDLNPLREFLKSQKQIEQSKLAAALKSGRFRKLVRGWGVFLAKPVPGRPARPAALQPILELASSRIWRAYRRVIRKGAKIGPESPSALLHRVRIDGKKLRYLIEFFRSLYPQDQIDRLITELKKLQDNLGDFNDYEVQQQTLRNFAGELHKQRVPAETLMAVGQLLKQLESGQLRERNRFQKRFQRFASPSNRRRFQKLFRGKPA